MAALMLMLLLSVLGAALVFGSRSINVNVVGFMLFGAALGFAFGMAAADTWGWPS